MNLRKFWWKMPSSQILQTDGASIIQREKKHAPIPRHANLCRNTTSDIFTTYKIQWQVRQHFRSERQISYYLSLTHFFQESSHAIVNWKSLNSKIPCNTFDKINCCDGARRKIINISNQELKSCSTISLLDV